MRGRIVVGVDGSEASRDALSWAADQADLTGAALVVVNAWGPIYPVGIDPEEKARKAVVKILELVLGADRAGAVQLVLSPDAPGHLLVHEAREADLLVVGSHGHGALKDALLGSVSEHCVHHAACPVVVIRAAARR